ncbi:unnamed protein product, partial [Phaeothamnion confervicola]
GQVVLVTNQIAWTAGIEAAVRAEAKTSGTLKSFQERLCAELLETVELVRTDVPRNLRTTLGAMVVMDVHNRDVTAELVALGLADVSEFDWLAQLRYYWKEGGASATSGKPGSVDCCMINASILYAYEYLGNNGRLVITPLTDRCYRTLMGAIHLNLGGAPEGPAGTGKTETTKDLGKAVAIQCVVTNCSDGLDYIAMGKFFKGLASSGAWACFDEFNRIQLEVLSVVAQQVLCIQQAKARGLEKFVFEGVELQLVHTCCPFITMNPGYAGRAELPDNLKVLFRTVAMMVPDYGMISEIILYSYGYTAAREMAVKIVTTYKLCSEQLSSQSHYDYGMRAVMAVLRAAGNLKRSEATLPEEVLILRSIIDVNLPKFLQFDVPLFESIVSDLFPGVKVPDPDRVAMRFAFETACQEGRLQPTAYFWGKVVQIYDMMVVRHGFMVVGLPFSGKSSAWKVLARVLELLHLRQPGDPRWSKVVPLVMNPKSVTMGQLYGQFDPISHEWADGVLAIQYRNAASNKIGEPQDRKWILFDGPVDAIWIENMNTVLDDNKKLCLMSGEIIAMTDVMSMVFEPMDLLAASPATVSRCGMVYMEPEQLGWRPLLDSWLQRFAAKTVSSGGAAGGSAAGGAAMGGADDDGWSAKFFLYAGERKLVAELFDWLVEPCLAYLRRELQEMSTTVDANLVQSLLNLLEVSLAEALKRDTEAAARRHGSVVEKARRRSTRAMRVRHIECCFVFSLIWSVGASGTGESQARMLEYLANVIQDVGVIEAEWPGVWNALQVRCWQPPDFSAPGRVFSGELQLPIPDGSGAAAGGIKIKGVGGDAGGAGPATMRSFFYAPTEGWLRWESTLSSELDSLDSSAAYSDIVVPNAYTAQYTQLLASLLMCRKKVLVCGPTGTGKSLYAARVLARDLPPERCRTVALGFSAKTSANMTQDIIDGKLDRRRKGVLGPPLGQTAVVFVDDLNMPEVETYGAQPPLELLRQLIDSGGWYNLKDMTWQTVADTVVVGAMGPPGGGRNPVTPRLLRHFNLLCFADFDDGTLTRIFRSVVDWHFKVFRSGPEFQAMSTPLVAATLDTFRAAAASLLPTPAKSHYTFNLRDFSRVIQGVLMARPGAAAGGIGGTGGGGAGAGKALLARLWTHESLRVFADRLVDDADRDWFAGHLEAALKRHFALPLQDLFRHLLPRGTGTVGAGALRRLFFGSFAAPEGTIEKPYIEIESAEAAATAMEAALADFNSRTRKPMTLVLFAFAVEHVSRISRVIRMPGGNALLVGVGGSGRQSCCRLAVHMAEYTLFQVEISKNYGVTEWREDLKSVLRGAGTGSQPLTFLFSDAQIKRESFVEDINNILNSGEVPNLFANDEKVAICEQMRNHAKKAFGKKAAEMTTAELWRFFVTRVRQQLHVVLALSPIGDAFRERLRRFPSLVNCCAIDWFSAWPQDALVAVSEKFLADVEFESKSTRAAIVDACRMFHADTVTLSAEYLSRLRRRNYVTPTSYLELIVAFKTALAAKREQVKGAKRRYEVGLEKLAFATQSVNGMQRELENLKPVLAQSQLDTAALMEEIVTKLPGVETKRAEVKADASVAEREAALVDAVEADLAEAMPALESAIKALDTIKQSEINEVRKLFSCP